MSVPATPRRGLVARLYLFSFVQVFVVVIAVPWVAHLASHPPMRMHGLDAFARYAAQTFADDRGDPVARDRDLARMRTTMHAELTLYDARGAVLASTVQPPVARPTRTNPPEMPGPPPMLFDHGPPPLPPFVEPVPGGEGEYVVYRPPSLPPPPHAAERTWALILALIGCALASVLLARTMATPLARLAATARSFGAGQLAARTGIQRRDEFGQVARAFDEMAERVARLIRGQRELLANLSHELRTPLARIRVALDIAAEGDTAAARESLTEIGEDLGELERLVDDVLQTARLDLSDEHGKHGVPMLRRQVVDVADLVQRSVARFGTRHAKGRLTVDDDKAATTLEADPSLLRRALDNVLDNAAKYSEPGTRVVLRVRGGPASVLFEVEDEGIGIERSDLAQIGTPFFRTDRSRARRTGGVGLGMSLTRRIVEAHGGTLTIESTPAIGTVVRLTLPA